MPNVKETHLTSAMAKGIPFTFKTGGVRYKCHLQDRSAYERVKATRTASSDSITTNSSSASSTKSH
ncbi:hypothetical protein B0T11DRAFT_323140 [Plectosphaerella cucumerina]|uniref:Uncharacterized protein n=1 Tax=Plectosphaerella cucumerina TaxID=40658 RepID=A0A8K0X7N5_9PEZI|nr:hypothetical protein B0T11DRAFT_323140 [Plectosphaerella cucumerina]